MKKFFTILLLVVIVVGAVWFAWHFYWVFGEGVKAGQLNNFTKKGYVFKTYEGKLIQAGFQGGAPGSVQSNEFRFSVANESVAAKLWQTAERNLNCIIRNIWEPLPWRGTSVFIVDSVLSMRDSKGLLTPYTP